MEIDRHELHKLIVSLAFVRNPWAGMTEDVSALFRVSFIHQGNPGRTRAI